ncbi:hypothetical protein [Streptomyces hawaiiensis]
MSAPGSGLRKGRYGPAKATAEAKAEADGFVAAQEAEISEMNGMPGEES